MKHILKEVTLLARNIIGQKRIYERYNKEGIPFRKSETWKWLRKGYMIELKAIMKRHL